MMPNETIPEDVRKLAKDRADWVVDAVATSTQNRQFLRGEPEEDNVATESIFLNAEKAISVAIMADRASRATGAEPMAWLCRDMTMGGRISIIMDGEHAALRAKRGSSEWIVEPLYAAPQPDANAELVDYEILCSGEFAASSSDLTDAMHYAAVYGKDGPVELFEVRRRPITIAKHGGRT